MPGLGLRHPARNWIKNRRHIVEKNQVSLTIAAP